MQRFYKVQKAIMLSALVLSGILVSTSTKAQSLAPSGMTQHEDTGYRPAEQRFETARTIGMGAGTRASVMGTSALALNPANLNLGNVYHIDSALSYLPNQGVFTATAAVADSVSNKLAMGMSTTAVFGNGNRDFNGYDLRVGAAMPLARVIVLGASLRYINVDSNIETQSGEPVGPGLQGFTFDAAVRVTPIKGLHLSVVGYTLLKMDSSLAPIRLATSASFSFAEMIEVGGDFIVDFTSFDKTTYIAGVGAEFLAGRKVPLRLGYRHDTGRNIHQVTASAGYLHQKFAVELGLRQNVGGQEKDTALMLSLRYHVSGSPTDGGEQSFTGQ